MNALAVRVWFVVLLVSTACCALARVALAAPDYPDRGAAPGSQSGDDATPFSGIAQTPGADLFSGAATTRIDIEVPPGRLNMTPELALTYSSHAGRSPYGYGWSLSLGRIRRSTKFGVPVYDNDIDTFVLELPGGTGELTKIPGDPYLYRMRVEGAYLKIGFDPTNNYWIVIDKSGTKFTFGNTGSMNSRTGPDITESATTFSWLLECVEDTFGNTIEYKYLAAATGEGSPPGLPDEILYGRATSPDKGHMFKVKFTWDSVVIPNGPVTYAEGFKRYIQGRRLAIIQTYAPNGATPFGSLARSYVFFHDLPADNYGTLRLFAVRLLAEPMGVFVPPSRFEYVPTVQLDFPTTYDFQQTAIGEGRFRGHDDEARIPTWDTFDLNGDAIVDYVRPVSSNLEGCAEATCDVRLGTGTSPVFGPGQSWNWPRPEGKEYVRYWDIENGKSSTKADVLDMTGDGLPDFIYVDGPGCGSEYLWCVWENTGFGFEDTPILWDALSDDIKRTDNDADLRRDTIDMNGDGLPDFINSDDWDDNDPNHHWDVYLNTGHGFDLNPDNLVAWWSPQQKISSVDSHKPTTKLLFGLSDMNGDGLPDFVDARKGSSEPSTVGDYTARWLVYLNNGHGFDTQPVSWTVEGAPANKYWLSDGYTRTITANGETETPIDLVDVTGDGLPDAMRGYDEADSDRGIPCTCPSSGLACVSGSTNNCYMNVVFVNTGASFSYPVLTPAWVKPNADPGKHPLRRTTDIQASFNNPYAPNDGQEFDLFDFDGDGLLDVVELVQVGGMNTWRFYRNAAAPRPGFTDERGKPSTLTSVMNGIGATTQVAYKPASLIGDPLCAVDVVGPDSGENNADGISGRCSPYPTWVVSSVTATDAVGNSPDVTTFYNYRNALYDGLERENRGFGLVWTVAATGVTTARHFHQDTACAGRMEREETFASVDPDCLEFDLTNTADPCSPLRYPVRRVKLTDNNWECAQALDTLHDSVPHPVLLRGTVETPYRRPPGGDAQVATDPYGKALTKETIYGYDADGNETSREMDSASAEPLIVHTKYEKKTYPSPGSMPDKYVVSRPTSVYSEYGNEPNDRFQETTWDYDDNYAVKKLSECQTWNASKTCASSVGTTYSDFHHGLPGKTTGPGTATTEYTYDAQTLFAAETVHPDDFKTTVSSYDYRLGKPTETVDKSGQPTLVKYDGLGRLRELWGPLTDRFERGEVSITYNYPNVTAAVPVPGSVKQEQFGNPDAPTDPVVTPSVTFYDGFARVMAVKREVQIGPNGALTMATRIDGLKVYDDAGRVLYGALPFQTPTTQVDIDVLNTTLSSPPTQAYTENEYEPKLGSLSKVWLPDRTSEIYDSTVPGVLAKQDAQGLVTLEYSDGFGRVVLRDQCSAMPFLANGNRCSTTTLKSRARLAYDGLDRVIEQLVTTMNAAQAEVEVETVSYDGVGNITQRVDANSNSWIYTYSSSTGLLVSTETPRGDLIRRKYDTANRLVQESAKDESGSKLKHRVVYEYVPPAVDTDPPPLGAGEVQVVAFIGPKKSGARQIRTLSYDERSRVASEEISMRGAQKEVSSYAFQYGYDSADRLISTSYPSSTVNVDDFVYTDYAPDGKVSRVYRDSAHPYVRAGYDLLDHRTWLFYDNGVRDLASYKPTSQNSYLDCLRTTRKTAPPENACAVDPDFDLRVVKYAGRDADGRDDTGRIKQINDLLVTNNASPRSNRHIISYDVLGRLSSVTYGGGATETFTYDSLNRLSTRNGTMYHYQREGEPFAISALETASVTTGLDYDDNGNRKQSGTTNYAYTPSGSLAVAQIGDYVIQRNAYGPDGTRIASYDYDNEEITHYYDGRFEIHGDTIVRHFYIGGQRVASDRIDAPEEMSLGSIGSTASRARSHDDPDGGFGSAAANAAPIVILLVGLVLAGTSRTSEGRIAALTTALYIVTILPVPLLLRRSASAWLGSQLAHAQGLDETIFYHVDHLGSTQLITDMAKVVVEEFRYDVFGKIRWGEEPSTSLGYTGHEPDNETGLVYFGARHLNPEDGAFMSVDPAGQYPSPYVHGGYDPMNGRDADGTLFQSDGWVDALIAVVDGYVSGVGSSSNLEGGGVKTPQSSSSDDTAPTNGLTQDAIEAFEKDKRRRWELLHKPCVGDAISEGEKRAVGSQAESSSSGDSGDGSLDSATALEHYRSGEGTPLRMSFDEIDTSAVRPSQFRKVSDELSQGSRDAVLPVDDRLPFSTSGDQALFLGDITLRLQGELTISNEGTFSFSGMLKSFDDSYDFNRASRGIIGETLTSIGRGIPGKPYSIEIRGAKAIREVGRLP